MEFRGPKLTRIPKESGLYAWYYKPLVINDQNLTKVLSAFLEFPGEISTEIEMRYGVRMESRSNLNTVYGTQRKPAEGVLEEAVSKANELFADFLRSTALELFTRPIYVGIAKNLRSRIYEQHYQTLVSMWDIDSSVSRCLITYPNADVKLLMQKLKVPHSFALEARARGIAPRDLIVHVFPTKTLPEDIGLDEEEIDEQSETESRRALERLFQLIADPIFGRR